MIHDDTPAKPDPLTAAVLAVEAAPAPTSPPRPRFEDLPPAAQRALREAEERRRAQDATAAVRPKEFAGRDGPEPIRYGDWEKKGLISDF